MTPPHRTDARPAFEASLVSLRARRKRYGLLMFVGALILALPFLLLFLGRGDSMLVIGLCVGSGLALFVFSFAKVQLGLKNLACPVCGEKIMIKVAGYCPDCGGALDRPGDVITRYSGGVRNCTSCGKAIGFGGAQFRTPSFVLRYCTFCSAHLADGWDFLKGK